MNNLAKLTLLLCIVIMLIPNVTVNAASPKYITVTKTVTKKKYLGKFKITFYCPCSKCSGSHGRKTATGTTAKEGRTIAVDKRLIPYGSKIKIGKKTYTAEDCGSAINGKRIDIFMESHKKCLKNGIKYKKVYLITKVKKKEKVYIGEIIKYGSNKTKYGSNKTKY